MNNEAHPGSDAWIEALDYPPEARAEVKENRRRHLQIEKARKQQEEKENRRVFGGNYISNYTRHHLKESVLRRPESGQTLKQPKEPTPD